MCTMPESNIKHQTILIYDSIYKGARPGDSIIETQGVNSGKFSYRGTPIDFL